MTHHVSRVPDRDPAQASSPEILELIKQVAALRGEVLNLHRVLANQPAALEAFMVMSKYIRNQSSLSDSMREIITLAVAFELNSEYEIHQHLPIAQRVGIDSDKLAALRKPGSEDLLTARERAAVQWARALARNHTLSDGLFNELSQHLDAAELVDVALTIGWYSLCSVVIEAFNIRPETKQA